MYGFFLSGDHVRRFMNDFLKGKLFDDFTVRHMEIFSVAHFETDGRINPDFLPEGESRSYCLWRELKGAAFFLIKGSIKPRIFKTVLALSPEKTEELHKNAASMHITITFEKDRVVFLTGTSQKKFSLDKDTDRVWEEYVKEFFISSGYEPETF